MSVQDAISRVSEIAKHKPNAASPRPTETILSVFSELESLRRVISAGFQVAQDRCGELRDSGKAKSVEYSQANATRAALSAHLTGIKRYRKPLDAERRASFEQTAQNG